MITSGKRSASVSCRDKGWRGADAGAWCLSWLGNHDPLESHRPRTPRGASRTGTRPPPIPTSAPCPYSRGADVFCASPIGLFKFMIGL